MQSSRLTRTATKQGVREGHEREHTTAPWWAVSARECGNRMCGTGQLHVLKPMSGVIAMTKFVHAQPTT